MKKLLLLVMSGFLCVSANAQENNSLMIASYGYKAPVGHLTTAKSHSQLLAGNNSSKNHAAKTTNVTPFDDWFDYWGENNSTSSVAYYFNVYPDSNLYDASSSSYVYCHGLGMSFDPLDDYYYSSAVAGIDDPRITATMTYSIDSFFVSGKYIRNNPSSSVVDSLIINLVATSVGVDSGTYKLAFAADANFAAMAPDSVGRFVSALYTPSDATGTPFTAEAWDSIKVLHKTRIAIALDANFYKDTDLTTGDHDTIIALTTPIQVPAGQKVVSVVSFKSGVPYTFGTAVTAANYYHLYAGDPGGASTWPIQSINGGQAGSYQTGLIAQNQDAYTNGANNFTYQGHLMVIPSVAFQQPSSDGGPNPPTGTEVPIQAFHVTYDTGTLAVHNVANVVNKVIARPNPATSQLTVAFTCSNATNVTVSLTNMLGQVVATQNLSNVTNGAATFNTTELPAGMYLYTVQADGQRTAGNVMIAH